MEVSKLTGQYWVDRNNLLWKDNVSIGQANDIVIIINVKKPKLNRAEILYLDNKDQDCNLIVVSDQSIFN